MQKALLIDPRFTLGQAIRESRRACVYEAKHLGGAAAWVKVARAPEHGEVLKQEAQLSKALGAMCMRVQESGVSDAGLPFLVIEPVEGQRVDHWVRNCGGRAPVDEVLGLGDELCQAASSLHRQGVGFGALRTDMLLVVPRGGICFIDLEEARTATRESKQEDAVLVGRLLYEVLAGRSYATDALSLGQVAPELPKAILTVVEEAAHGAYAGPDELRKALALAAPPWLGGMRRPVPSRSIHADTMTDFSELVLPRSSRQLLFDPTTFVERPRSASDTSRSQRRMTSITGDSSAASRVQATSSTAAVAAPPPSRPAPSGEAATHRRGSSVLISGAIGVAAAVLVIASFAILSRRGASPHSAFTQASGLPVGAAVAPPITPAPAPSPAPAPAREPAPEPALAASSAPAPAPSKGADTRFRFEGDLSPRLVIVDNVVIGTTVRKDVHHRCGWHSVKIGGKGLVQSIELPCGGEQRIAIESNGVWRAE